MATILDDPRSFHSCDLCHYGSRSLNKIVSHIKRHNSHSTVLPFECDKIPEAAYRCEHCEFESDLLVNLSDHNNVVHKETEIDYDMRHILMPHSCANCSFHTHSLLVLLKHVCDCDKRNVFIVKEKNSRGEPQQADESLFKCKICSHMTKHKSNLHRHVRDMHTNPEDIKWFECDQCSYKAKRRTHLEKHKLSKHTRSDEGQWLECGHCGLKTRHKNSLRSHIKSKHSTPKEVRWFSCAMCAFKTKYKFNLKEHVMGRHRPTNKVYKPFIREQLSF